jgi:DNA-binding beta-propeller fold protein YncE
MKLSLILISLFIVFFGIWGIIRATINSYTYGAQQIVDVQINPAGDKLYASYSAGNAVVEIDTNTMDEIRRFEIYHPTFIDLSPDGYYLYAVTFSLDNYLVRIRLSDGHKDTLQLEGYVNNFCMDPPGLRLWIASAVWPGHGDMAASDEFKDHPGTGRITEVDLITFSITRVAEIDPIPVSIWYSPYSDLLYVYHEGKFIEINGPYEEDLVMSDKVCVYDLESIRKVDEFYGGLIPLFLNFPNLQLTNWDDAGRYLAIPDPGPAHPAKSMRIIDTSDNSIEFDLSIINDIDDTMGFRYAHKVPGMDIMWAVAYHGMHDQDIFGIGESVVRINTATQEYEFFTLEGVLHHMGDFAVSADGNTLYIPVIKTGEIFVWSPD